MSISPNSKNDLLKKAKQTILGIYGQESPDILSFPFHQKVERSIVLMDYSGGLYGELLRAISTVAQNQGDSGFYLSYPVLFDKEVASPPFVPYWYIPFDEGSDYIVETETFVYRYTHYSPQGLWGIVASNDVFGVLSGTNAFMQQVLQLAPELSNDVNNFIVYWAEHKKRHSLNIDWIPLFLRNVYGASGASELIDFLKYMTEASAKGS